RYPEARFYAVGAIPPIPSELLPAWQRATPDPDRVRRALRAWLPPEVEVTSAGCLHLAGPSLLAGPFHEWPRVTRGGHPFFLLSGDRLYELPGDWWVRRSDQSVEHDQMVDEQFCLDHVDPALSVLRRSDTWLHDAVNGAAIFDAEWV